MTAGGGKVLLLGADGFIGRHIALALKAHGYAPLCIARATGALAAMGFDTLRADLEDAGCHDPAFWRDATQDAVAVVNAAGLLSGAPARLRAVHELAPAALYQAMPDQAALVLISATGAEADTVFGAARRAGESVALNTGLRVSILRPGLVLGETSYGGSSVLRGLAALPGVTPLVGDGGQVFDPLHAGDLAALVVQRLDAPDTRAPIPVGGADTLDQRQILAALRGWMGLPPARVLRLPLPLARVMGRIGDLMRLGPISAASVAQLEHGVLTERENRIELPGLSSFLDARPAGTQDLWHARLYLLRPLLRITLAILWLVSGLLGLLAPLPVLSEAIGNALPDTAALILARAGGLLDLAIALALLRGWRLRQVFWVQIVAILGYTCALTVLHPVLWLDPYGALLKNLPILALILVHRILEQER